MNIVVTGGSGFVGGHLLSLLKANTQAEHTLFSVSRDGDAPAGVTGIKADVVSGEGLDEAMRHADAVIHLVGIIQEKGEKVTFENVHVRGTEQVLAAATRAGVQRYLHMSALGADSQAKSDYLRTKAQAEQRVQASSLRWTIFCPSLIFGKGDAFFGKTLKTLVSLPPIIPQIGDGHFPFRPIWVGDVARAFQQALNDDATIGKRYPLVGPKEYTFHQLLEVMKDALGVHKPIVPIPLALMNVAVPMMGILPNPPISQDQYLMLRAGNTAAAEPMQAAFTLPWKRLEQVLPSILQASDA